MSFVGHFSPFSLFPGWKADVMMNHPRLQEKKQIPRDSGLRLEGTWVPRRPPSRATASALKHLSSDSYMRKKLISMWFKLMFI